MHSFYRYGLSREAACWRSIFLVPQPFRGSVWGGFRPAVMLPAEACSCEGFCRSNFQEITINEAATAEAIAEKAKFQLGFEIVVHLQ